MSRDSFFLPGAEGSRVRLCLRGMGLFPRPRLPAGRDFGPVRTCGAFPPTAARRAPHRSRSHGRLRRPKSLPIRHSPAAAQCFSPWAAGIASVLTSWLHRFASLGLKSRIDARFALVLPSLLHRFASLGLKSRIIARKRANPGHSLQRFPISAPELAITAAPDPSLDIPAAKWSEALYRGRGMPDGQGLRTA